MPLLAIALVAAAGLWVASGRWRPTRTARVGKGDAVFESPYKNTRPGVEYVGDAACARCHAEIAESYHRHPMGRSLIAVDSEPRGEAERASFEAQGFHYPGFPRWHGCFGMAFAPFPWKTQRF